MKGVLLLSAAVLLDVQTGVVGALSLEASAADELSSARPSGRRLQATCCDAVTISGNANAQAAVSAQLTTYTMVVVTTQYGRPVYQAGRTRAWVM